MGDYSFVKTGSGRVVGMWLADPATVQRKGILEALLAKHDHTDSELFDAVVLGKCRVVPNTFDANGGCFVMCGSYPAPGE